VRCFDEDKDCEWLREKYPQRKMLMISDIRGVNLLEGTNSFDKECDNEIQLKAIQRLRPVASLLKFAVPDWSNRYYTYAPGVILIQTFCYFNTAEVRLLVEGVPDKLVKYDSAALMDRITFHHERRRGQVYRSTRRPELSSGCLDFGFDCTVLWDTVRHYSSRNAMDPHEVLRGLVKEHLYVNQSENGCGLWHDVKHYVNVGRLMEAAGALTHPSATAEEESWDWASIAECIPQQPDIAERLRGLPRPASRADVLRVIGGLARPFTLVRSEMNGLVDFAPWSWIQPRCRGLASRLGPGGHNPRYDMDFAYYKKQLCYFYAKGQCSKGEYCTYSHGDGDHLQSMDKQPTCWWFQNGACPYADKCFFRHESACGKSDQD
jgi:hypothetical protein